MATKKEFTARCSVLGVAWDWDGETLTISAPAGTVFANVDAHCMSITNAPAGAWKMSEMYELHISDMSGGVVDCTDPGCED